MFRQVSIDAGVPSGLATCEWSKQMNYQELDSWFPS